jgi:hypothetical protein
MGNAGIDLSLKYQELRTSYSINGKQDNVFIPLSYLDEKDTVNVYKTYKDSNGGILAKDDIVEVTVTLEARKRFSGAFGDKIQ